jgi:hypothetical protein
MNVLTGLLSFPDSPCFGVSGGVDDTDECSRVGTPSISISQHELWHFFKRNALKTLDKPLKQPIYINIKYKHLYLQINLAYHSKCQE